MLAVNECFINEERKEIFIAAEKNISLNNLWAELCELAMLREMHFEADYVSSKDFEICVLIFKNEIEFDRACEELKEQTSL